MESLIREIDTTRRTKAERQQVAETILAQLGGRQFLLMTGASKLTAWDGYGGLAFKLPSDFAKQGINIVRIKLTPMDDYTLEFVHIGRAPRYVTQTVDVVEGVYCDNLREVFERATGLLTNM